MSDVPFNDSLLHRRLRSSTRTLFWVGLAMLVLGIAAIVFPFFSTLVATYLVGWVLLFSGIIVFIGSFSIHGTGPFFGALLLGLLSIAAGVFLLFNPQAGAAALTLIVSVIFMFEGAFETVFAFEMRPHPGWVSMLISGICSIVLAILIAASWPGISTVVLGILLGVNFITTGIAYIFISRELKPLT